MGLARKMETNSILKQINGEIEDFKTKSVPIAPGLLFNQYQTIIDNIFAYNSKFKSGEIDDDGDRKYYLNVTKNPCKVFSKAIDFDTKNIRALTVEGQDPLKTWFLERDLKFWMRDKQFGKVLNRIFKEIPIHGSVVLKIIGSTPYFVDLRNFVIRQNADTLDDSDYIIEIHLFTPDGFRKAAKEMKWPESKVKETIEKFNKMQGVSHIRVYERYGRIPVQKEDGSYDYPNRRIYIADVGVDVYDPKTRELTAAHPGVELENKDYEGHPYWEFHGEKIPGRWLGLGVVESLKEVQISTNERINLQAKAAFWASLRLFFSRASNAAGNLKTDKKNGDVIIADDNITQIDMTDRNLAFFNDQDVKWMRNRDEMTFSYDVVQGERLPAGTPLGSAQIAMTQTLSYFEQIQEDIAMDVKEMLYKVILPSFETENSKEHTLRIVGQDLDTYISMVKNEFVAKEVIRLAIESLTSKKPFPTDEDKKVIEIAVEETIKQGREILLTVPKDFYKNLKYDIDIDITGESVDTRMRYATKFAILQAITADPTMTTDPFKKAILMSMAEDGGINLNDFIPVTSNTEEKMAEMTGMGRAGGGVSAPALGNKVPGQMMQTV